MNGFGGSIFTMLGGAGKPNFSLPEVPKIEKGKEEKIERKPETLLESELTIDIPRTSVQWKETGMLDGFTFTEEEKLTILYNEIIENRDLWDEKYKEYYLLAANYSFRALREVELPPSTKERLLSSLEAKRFILDMNKIFDGLLEVTRKYLPNSNSEFGIMCLFSHSYVGEIVACEKIIEQMKNEIFK